MAGNIRKIAVNAAGGAVVSVLSTICARQARVIEDEATTPQGLVYNVPDDGFAGVYTLAPSTQPIILGNEVAAGGATGGLAGNGPQPANFAATITLVKLISVNQATSVRVSEIP